LFALVKRTGEDVSLKEDVGSEAIMGLLDRESSTAVHGKALQRC